VLGHEFAGTVLEVGAEAYARNLTFRSGRCPARALLPRMLELAASGRHDLTRLISHRLPLSAGPEAYDRFARRADGCTKVVLAPGS
jgi:threonine dehydrogenase-like Zn-dependent dehydrogenase